MSLVTVTWAWAKEGNSFASAGHMSQLMSSKRTAKERQPRAATCQQECTPITQSAHSWGGKPWETSYNFGLGMWKGDTKTEFAVQNRCSGHFQTSDTSLGLQDACSSIWIHIGNGNEDILLIHTYFTLSLHGSQNCYCPHPHHLHQHLQHTWSNFLLRKSTSLLLENVMSNPGAMA